MDANLLSDYLRNPLNETTRKARRNLLAASVVGIVISKVGLVPSKISAFGIDFTTENHESLILLLVFAIAYFTLTFVVYLLSELMSLRLAFWSVELKNLKKEILVEDSNINSTFYEQYPIKRTMRTYWMSGFAVGLRLVIEVLVPIAFAIYSGIALLNTAPPTTT